jgi:hypothetical protein
MCRERSDKALLIDREFSQELRNPGLSAGWFLLPSALVFALAAVFLANFREISNICSAVRAGPERAAYPERVEKLVKR